MKDRTPTARVDQDLCVGCELCLATCPDRTFSMDQGKARVTGDRCLACEHCVAVCPTGAVTLGAAEPHALDFTTFTPINEWLPPGDYDLPGLVALMRSRRSCRNYLPDPVPRDQLEDLVKIGTTAPSGTNSQLWTFTILPDRQAVTALGDRIGVFFRKLNAMARKAWLRKLTKLLGKGELDQYYREHYQSVSEAMEQWETQGIDRLFHGAPAAMVVGSRPGASCPAEDALLASGQILLAAHAMGLGTCLIGYAVEAMDYDPGIKDFLGIPKSEAVHAVIVLGYPDEKYQRLTGRRQVTPRYFHPAPQESP